MKNLTLLNEKDTELFLENIWSTEIFRNSFKNKEYIWEKTKGFLGTKRYFAEMSDLKIENSHFYSWFNILILKKYENPIIQDLYFLHELNHISTLVYDSSHSFGDWSYKMIQNEIEASIESEVFVYHFLNIRDQSFSFEIWADLLPKNLSKTEIFFKRMDALINPKNQTEKQLSKYLSQNYDWVNLWENNYKEVEENVKKLHETGDHISFERWIEKRSVDGILFKELAEDFSKIYLKNKSY